MTEEGEDREVVRVIVFFPGLTCRLQMSRSILLIIIIFFLHSNIKIFDNHYLQHSINRKFLYINSLKKILTEMKSIKK